LVSLFAAGNAALVNLVSVKLLPVPIFNGGAFGA